MTFHAIFAASFDYASLSLSFAIWILMSLITDAAADAVDCHWYRCFIDWALLRHAIDIGLPPLPPLIFSLMPFHAAALRVICWLFRLFAIIIAIFIHALWYTPFDYVSLFSDVFLILLLLHYAIPLPLWHYFYHHWFLSSFRCHCLSFNIIACYYYFINIDAAVLRLHLHLHMPSWRHC